MENLGDASKLNQSDKIKNEFEILAIFYARLVVALIYFFTTQHWV